MRRRTTTALATYVPIAKWVDRAPSPRPFIGVTFLLFALFPICLVLLPKASVALGLPVMAGLVLTFVLNGLRELTNFDSGMAEVQSIGAGATNQAIKAVAIARSYLSEEGVDIVCTPSFIDVSIDDEEHTAIRLLVERRA